MAADILGGRCIIDKNAISSIFQGIDAIRALTDSRSSASKAQSWRNSCILHFLLHVAYPFLGEVVVSGSA